MRTTQDLDVLIEEPSANRKRGLYLALITLLVVAVSDQLSKAWAVSRLADAPCTPDGNECIDLVGSLRFHLVYNPGASFSMGGSFGRIFGVIALVMSIVLVNFARKRFDRLGPILLGLIAGGALGNLGDRVARAEEGFLSGAVVDFIDLQWWPIWNIADAAVVVGVIGFMTYSFFWPEAGLAPAGSPGVDRNEDDQVASDDLDDDDLAALVERDFTRDEPRT